MAWRIRSARPDLKLILHAVDISQQALGLAENGVYSLAASQFAGTDMLDLVTEAEIEELFDRRVAGDDVGVGHTHRRAADRDGRALPAHL